MPTATIVGAGVFGAWIAHALNDHGWTVTLVDQHGPANSRASSGGETRIIRSGYGDLAVYARWAQQSLPSWLELERRCGERLFLRTGALFLGSNAEWLHVTLATLRAEKIGADWLEPGDLSERYPQLRFPAAAGAVFEPGAGVLFARRGVQALVRDLVSRGVAYLQRHVNAVAEIRDNRADALVFACGPWLPGLFPELLGDAIRPTRQEVFFFGPPAGEDSFSLSRLPAWVAFDEGIYGLPDLEHRGVKVAIDAHGPAADPETMSRVVSERTIHEVRALLARRLPGLATAPLLESRVCQYENTSNGHFLLDRLPGHDRVWVAGGGSGHGFKHGPAIGSYMAGLLDERQQPDPRFVLSGRAARERAVY